MHTDVPLGAAHDRGEAKQLLALVHAGLEEVVGASLEDLVDDIALVLLRPDDHRYDGAEGIGPEGPNQLTDLIDLAVAVEHHQRRVAPVDQGHDVGGGSGPDELGLPARHVVRQGLWRWRVGRRIEHNDRW